MQIQSILIGNIPSVLWGNNSNRLYLYIHGQNGNKEEAATFAEIVCRKGWQVLSIDLPGHGERRAEINSFNPWHIIPELHSIEQFIDTRWKRQVLFANSIGAWFSLLCFENKRFEQSLFVSPVLDMKLLISKMMNWANVTEEQLERAKLIPTSFGQDLSWEYWQYVLEHPVVKWGTPTKILYGEHDNMIDYSSVEDFARKFHCKITVMKDGEHWFHTEPQVTFLKKWVADSIPSKQIDPQLR